MDEQKKVVTCIGFYDLQPQPDLSGLGCLVSGRRGGDYGILYGQTTLKGEVGWYSILKKQQKGCRFNSTL
jgi:hypothetical protein